ncbi:MAG: hypothetical protein WCT44_04045 [Candidatus Paceibacterota bacterium]
MIDKIFGGPLRLKIMKLFLFNPIEVFDLKVIAKKTESRLPAVKKEMKVLLLSGLIKTKIFKNEKGRKQKGLILNNNFGHTNTLKDFLVKISPLSETQIFDKISKAGKPKFAAVSGVFINNPECRVDLLIVGDKFKKNILARVISSLESELGSELRYAFFETADFEYRRSFGDKLVRDILEYPHKIIVDKLGITS